MSGGLHMRWPGALICAAAGLLGGCSRGAQAPPGAPAVPPLPSAVARLVSVPIEYPAYGIVEAVEHSTLSAQTSGRVTELRYDVGEVVPAGAVVARLRGTEQRAGLAQAQAAVAAARARSTEAAERYARIARLYRQRVLPKADFDRVRSERDAAEAQLAAAQAGLTSAREGVAYTEIRAPYRFVVAKRLVQVGEAVVPGTPLMDSVALRQLRVNVEVPQSIAATVRRLQRALVYAADAGNACFEASQITLSPQAAIASSTFAARLAVPEQASSYPCPLEPGMYVRVGLVVGETPRLLIPASAIVQRSEVTAAYVLDGHGGIGLRYLRLGHRQGDRVEVLAGLSADERVVTDVPAAIAAIVAAGRR